MPLERSLADALGGAVGFAVRAVVAIAPIELEALSPAERDRARELGEGPRLEAWLMGRAALRRLFSELGEPDDTPAIRFPHPRISLTHSHSFAVALGLVEPACRGVGVDLELGRGPADAAARLFLREEERRSVASLDLRRLWTVKEALFKANPENADTWFTDYRVEDPAAEQGRAVLLRGRKAAMRYASVSFGAGILSAAVLPE